MYKRLISLAAAALFLSMTAQAHAVGFEIAVGGWQQTFGGTLGYNEILDSDDILDIDNDLDFDEETKFMGRIKIDLPMAIPNIYVMAAPMQFEGKGSKSVVINYGDLNIPVGAELESDITVNQYDIALYWGLPFLKTATANTFNIDVGLNVRIVDLEARLRAVEPSVSYDEEDSVSVSAPIPMLYVAFQITPVEAFAIEAEGRGISIGDNSLYSIIGRLRYKFAGPVFVAGGYRLDKLEIDEEDVEADIDFSGPFVELGVKF